MGKYDEPILEFFEETGIAAPPSVVTHNLDRMEIASPAHTTVKRRMITLREHGLLRVDEEDAGYYELTETGSQYLAGEIGGDDL
jgi:DNA-binding IclR family transcriptional regulator